MMSRHAVSLLRKMHRIQMYLAHGVCTILNQPLMVMIASHDRHLQLVEQKNGGPIPWLHRLLAWVTTRRKSLWTGEHS